MANAPIPNLTAPIACVLVNATTGGQYKLGAFADVAAPATASVPNLTAPVACVLFDTVNQVLYRT